MLKSNAGYVLISLLFTGVLLGLQFYIKTISREIQTSFKNLKDITSSIQSDVSLVRANQEATDYALDKIYPTNGGKGYMDYKKLALDAKIQQANLKKSEQ